MEGKSKNRPGLWTCFLFLAIDNNGLQEIKYMLLWHKGGDNMAELARKNIRMSVKIAGWYEEKSRELGISQNSLMVMALNEYIKQDRVIDMVELIKKMERTAPSE